MGILLYQKFNGEKFAAQGEWQKTSMDQISDKRFFIANHDHSSCYSFSESNSIDGVRIKDEIHLAIKKSSNNVVLSEQKFKSELSNFQQEMTAQSIRKAIFSRVEQIKGTIDANTVFNSLCEKYREKAFIYLIAAQDFGVWVGATPEVLIQGEKKHFVTMALAGTKPDASSEWTSKEIEEQNMVREFIRSTLTNLNVTQLSETEVETVFSGSVYHLSSRFEFNLDPLKVINIIRKLHPTSAVCGLPRDKAMRLIRSKEPHQRKFYTGTLGWVNNQEAQTFVNLRCMEVFENSADLYVGGGITKDSNIEKEWQETLIKANTLKSVIETHLP